METGTTPQKITIAFINDKNPILDCICNDLIASGFKVLFRSENIHEGLSQLYSLTELPNVCVIDLDFYDKSILAQLQELRTKYPSIKLIAHSDIDNEEIGKTLLDIGFSSYLLIGSDVDNFIKAIGKIANG